MATERLNSKQCCIQTAWGGGISPLPYSVIFMQNEESQCEVITMMIVTTVILISNFTISTDKKISDNVQTHGRLHATAIR